MSAIATHQGGLPLIVVMSVAREPAYIHQTLASLFMSDRLVQSAPVHVMVGGADVSYLADYSHHPNLIVHPLPAGETDKVSSWGVHRRHAYNYHRCLAMPGDDSPGLCVCEDDVVFKPGFLAKLAATIAEMEQNCGLNRYVLAAYAASRPDTARLLPSGSSFCKYPEENYYGTQCMYYPRAVLDELAPYFYDQAVEQTVAPSDMMIKAFCQQTSNLFACKRSLVQHIGRTTTGLGDFHTSPTFAAEWNDVQSLGTAIKVSRRARGNPVC